MKKKASELVAGDIVFAAGGERRAVLTVLVDGLNVAVEYARVGIVSPESTRCFEVPGNTEVEVSPHLQPDDLASLVDVARHAMDAGANYGPEMRELVDRLTPPVPPTLDEVLRVLVAQYESTGPGSSLEAHENANVETAAIIGRARRAGLL